jgi:site-specific DNA recombinase
MEEAMQKAVIYCRVSSPEQVKNGHGLSSQETRCREFARHKKLEVVEVFAEEGISGSMIDRPAMTQMLDYLRQHEHEQIVVIIDDISRLARGVKAHLELRIAIRDAGGVLQSPSIEFGEDSDSQLVENLLASVSQHQRQKNAEQVKNRMRARMMSGYWILCPPRGYKMEKRGTHGKMLVRDEPLASVIQEAMEGFASDRFSSPVEVKNFLAQQPVFPKDRKGEVHMQRVLDMLNRKLYSGYFDYPEWNIGLTKGHHEPIISFETFCRIQDKLHGRAKVPARHDISHDFPLRGFVTCDCCGVPMKSCWTQGRNGKYPYYLCQTKGCEHYGKSIKRDYLEDEFVRLLKDLTPSDTLVDMVDNMLDQLSKLKSGDIVERRKELQNQILLIERKVEQFLDRIAAADSTILITSYERQIKTLEEQRLFLQERIQKCGEFDSTVAETARTAFQFFAKPYHRWVSGDISVKRLVLKTTFARPLTYDRKEGYRTAALSLPFSLFREFSDTKSEVVPPAGIEPALDYSKQILSLQRLPVPPRGPMKLFGNAAVKQMQAALQ